MSKTGQPDPGPQFSGKTPPPKKQPGKFFPTVLTTNPHLALGDPNLRSEMHSPSGIPEPLPAREELASLQQEGPWEEEDCNAVGTPLQHRSAQRPAYRCRNFENQVDLILEFFLPQKYEKIRFSDFWVSGRSKISPFSI